MVRPLAIETTRFDSILVGNEQVAVGGGMSGSEQCGISLSPLPPAVFPRVPASRDGPPDINLFACLIRGHHTVSHRLLIVAHPPPSVLLVQTDEDGRAVRPAGFSS